MSDSLFLPRELFQAAPVRPPVPPSSPTLQPRRRSVQFTSGAEVAADLLQAMNAPVPAFVERRQRPRMHPLHTTR